MFQSLIDDLKREFGQGTVLHRIIIINVLVFVGINIIKFMFRIKGGGTLDPFYHEILHFFSISSDLVFNLKHPWTILTSMFLHEGFWHLLWNMLFLYWFGRIVADLVGISKILPLYLLGGAVGGFAFWISATLLNYGGGATVYAIGASAAVMAIVVAAGVIAPEYRMRLLLIGDVKLKYVVLVLVFLDFVGIGNYTNTGGHFAHLGGAVLGLLFARELQRGNDWSAGVNSVLERMQAFFSQSVSASKPKRETTMVVKRFYRQDEQQADDLSYQQQLDQILDKISQSGYESLSKDEIAFLEDASNRK
ncbi:MAG: rhomboid family intramembrane serine protease [Saprospiraceae bacterium]|nr:rhomboid family intramembrane serine protease [Saprospiraceae bacterium]